VVKYPNSFPVLNAVSGATFTPTPTHRLYTWTGSGSFTT
jgi:hypothetical protein